ncbi:MAG TPA: hypothetical protein VGM66_07170 [Candidatus Udaeobacter sp.]|jgi:hypothetical protein
MAETPDPKPSKDNSKMGKRIAAQARDTVQAQDAKRTDLASGKKRFTEGK